MKKLILIALVMLGVSVAAQAQPRAIGLRGGYGVELSYQHTVSSENFVEADLGLLGFDALNVVATYNWMLAQPNWTNSGKWGVYAGPGVAVGFGFHNPTYLTAAVCGQVGLEYTFDFPLQLSVDIRPQLGFSTAGDHFYFGGFIPCLGIRYSF